MIKWFKLSENQFLGLFPLAFVFFALQELPYLILPALGISISPLMALPAVLVWLDFLEKFFGIGAVVGLFFLVRDPIKPRQIFLRAAVVPLLAYYIGWGIYALGLQNLLFYLFFLVAMPPIYYFFLGLWRRNSLTVGFSLLFLVVHLINFSINYLH